MKYFFFTSLLIININFANSQITINGNDLPDVGDSLRYSIAANATLFNFAQTDTNMTWDFSNLSPENQNLDFYQSPSSAPPSYQITFNIFNTDMCINKDNFSLYGNQISDVFFYYNKSNGKFEEVGYGAKINGVPFPVTYDNNDVIVNYPINYGDIDSSFMSWDVTIPSIGYVSQKKYKNYEVDGWGKIILPIGQFNCLRIKANITQIDSAYNQSFPIPLPAIISNYTEYFWITNSKKLPVLRVVIEDLSNEITAYYADDMQQFTAINNIDKNKDFTVYPNPAKDIININSTAKTYTLRIYNSNGKLIKTFNDKQKVNISNFQAGIYLIELISEDKRFTKKIIKKL